METAIPEQNVGAQEKEKEGESLEERIQNIEVKIENLRPKRIWERVKNLLVGSIVAVILLVIAWFLVGEWVIAIALVIIPASYFYTKYIYKPPLTPIFVVGHKDDNPDNMILIDVWGIPDAIMDEINLSGISSPISTPWGVGYLAESLKFDEQGNLIGIRFAWPHNNDLNFMTKHSLFHYIREENYILAKAYNFTKILLNGMALRIGFDYSAYITRYTGDEKISKGIKGIEDEKELAKHIAEADEQLRNLREKYGVKDVIDKDEAQLVPEG